MSQGIPSLWPAGLSTRRSRLRWLSGVPFPEANASSSGPEYFDLARSASSAFATLRLSGTSLLRDFALCARENTTSSSQTQGKTPVFLASIPLSTPKGLSLFPQRQRRFPANYAVPIQSKLVYVPITRVFRPLAQPCR